MPEASKPAEQTTRLEAGAEENRAARWMRHTGYLPPYQQRSDQHRAPRHGPGTAPPPAKNTNRRFEHDYKPNPKGNSTGQRVARKAGGHRRASYGQRKREAALPALWLSPALPAVC